MADMRIVCGPPWTADGRWVVIASPGRQHNCLGCQLLPEGACDFHDAAHIAYDPDNGVRGSADRWMLALTDIVDCIQFVKDPT